MKFRPKDDPHPGSPVEWADNWPSNTFAWLSYRVLPRWCQSEDHWTSRATQYFFTDCPCCLFFRGMVVGVMIVLPILAVIIITVAALGD